MCRYFCNGFIDFMLKRRSLLDYINLFSPNKYEKNNKILYILPKIWKNDKIILKYCQYRKFKNPKILYIFEKKVGSFYHLQ